MEELQDDEEFCFLCKKSNTDFVDLSYKMECNSVKQDLRELYGDMVATYLHEDEVACLTCVQVLQGITDIKRCIYDVIVDNAVSLEVHGRRGNKPFNSCQVWSEKISSLFSTPASDNLGESISPNGLLMVTGSIPYHERCDNVDRNYNRYDCDTPGLDREVQRVTSRGRFRRRGHKWTRRKGSQTRSNSVFSRSTSRFSHTSKASRTTVNSTGSRTTNNAKKKNQQQSLEKRLRCIVGDFFYQGDTLHRFTREYLKKLINGDDDNLEVQDSPIPHVSNKMSVKTRFACEIRDKLISEYQQLIYECPYNSCEVIMYTLENITEHRVKMHNDMALFLCEQCRFYYLTQDDLEKHRDLHYKNFIAYCIYCSEEFKNKRLYEHHLNEHLIHSFPCGYCDRFFLGKQHRENHIKTQHPGMNTKIKRIKRQSILDRIDKKPTNDDRSHSENESQEFVVKVLRQHGQPEVPKLVEDDLEEIDISLENSLSIDNDITFS